MSRRELSDSAAVTRSQFECSLVLLAFWGLKKYIFEVDDPPEARTWASKKYLFEVDVIAN